LAQGGLSVAGKKVELSTPVAVAVGVTQVYWQGEGKALVFYASDVDGKYLGVFNQESGKAKPAIRFTDGTEVRYEAWLPSRPVYLIATSRPVVGREWLHWAVTAIDARSMTAREVWSSEFPKEAEVGIHVEASPSLDHALITVNHGKERTPIVLLDGAVSAVYSRDVAAAWAQGSEFVGWSVDGTAYFSASPGATQERALLGEYTLARSLEKAAAEQTVELKLKVTSGEFILDSIPVLSFLLKASMVAPVAGTPVLELMPRNANLRPVLSRGPYVGPEVFPHVVYPKQEPAQVQSEERRDGVFSLWMVRLTGDEAEPFGRDGVLIAGQAGNSWMCDDGNWVAYESFGALFVRRITYGGQPFSGSLVRRLP
jgi:hypothetical protein